MTSYLLEGYSRVERGELPDALALIQAAARSVAREGHPLRLGRAIVVPGDETWFHMVEAPSADAVELLVRRAGLRSVRITEAFECDEELRRRGSPIEPVAVAELRSTAANQERWSN